MTGKRGSGIALGASSAMVYVVLYVPVAVLILFSFNAARSGGRITRLTTAWYASLRDNERLLTSTWNSIYIAAVSTTIAVVLGTMLSLVIDRQRFRGRAAAQQVVYLPVIAPEIVTGISLLAFFSLVLNGLNSLLDRGAAEAFRLGRPTIIIAHVAFSTAFVSLVVRASLRNLDPAIEEAARDLGASPWVTFWKVTLPSITPGVLGGALLAFTLSLDNFVITFFVAGPGASTLPIEVFSQLRRTISPEVNAISTLIFVASSLVLLCGLAMMTLLSRRRMAATPFATEGDENTDHHQNPSTIGGIP